MKRYSVSNLVLLGALALAGPAVAQPAPALAAEDALGGLLFRVDTGSGLFAGGAAATGEIPATGAGVRMMWFPGRWAFRAGRVYNDGSTDASTYWDLANVGNGSAAFGTNTMASGANSFAAGLFARATGADAVAFGNYGVASGDRSFSYRGTASGVAAIAFGSGAEASGEESVAIGPLSNARGYASTAIGPTRATGSFAVAIGSRSSATGNSSIAIGNDARTARQQGSLVFGDGCAQFSGDSVYATANNQFVARACGGVQFYTNMGLTAGVRLASGGGAWETISDRNRKENVAAVDGEDLLRRLRSVPVSTWNYIAQDDAVRHMGPMAQDFHAAFGLGTDSLTITTSDIDGVALAGVQALTVRTDELRAENAALRAENETVRAEMAAMRERLDRLDGGSPGPVRAALPWLGGLALLGVAGAALRRRTAAPRA